MIEVAVVERWCGARAHGAFALGTCAVLIFGGVALKATFLYDSPIGVAGIAPTFYLKIDRQCIMPSEYSTGVGGRGRMRGWGGGVLCGRAVALREACAVVGVQLRRYERASHSVWLTYACAATQSPAAGPLARLVTPATTAVALPVARQRRCEPLTTTTRSRG